MERAIKSLCGVPDARLFTEISDGIDRIVSVVKNLDSAARTLSSEGQHHAARIVGYQAEEEAAKILVLIDAIRCPKAKAQDMARTLGYFYNHLAKGIYGDICNWRPVDFAEVVGAVDSLRKQHFLDGPNGIDWIFPNSILQRREDDLYVGYVRDDSQDAGQGDCWWTAPQNDDLMGYHTATVVNVVVALHEEGVTSSRALATIAQIWRPAPIRPEMDFAELAEMNSRTLKELEDRGLLQSSSAGNLSTIRNYWPFPLWPLDLTMIEVDKKTLRETRKRFVPD